MKNKHFKSFFNEKSLKSVLRKKIRKELSRRAVGKPVRRVAKFHTKNSRVILSVIGVKCARLSTEQHWYQFLHFSL